MKWWRLTVTLLLNDGNPHIGDFIRCRCPIASRGVRQQPQASDNPSCTKLEVELAVVSRDGFSGACFIETSMDSDGGMQGGTISIGDLVQDGRVLATQHLVSSTAVPAQR